MAVTTFVAFAPSLQNQFVDWDDLENFTTNPSYRGFGWTRLKWMWTTILLGHYVPITWMTLGLDYLVWEMNPAGYHLTNILLHSANAAVLYLVSLRLLGAALPAAVTGDRLAQPLGAAFAALLFAVHPLRVESVAWVTERRDVLSGLFFLLAILAYLRDAEVTIDVSTRRRLWYWVSLGCFVLALLSKAITVTLPVVLIVLDVYPLRRLGGAAGWWSPGARQQWAAKVPFVLASTLVIPVALIAARGAANLVSMADVGVLERLAISLYGLAFYLWKMAVPLALSPFYALRIPALPPSAPYVVSGLLVAVITGLAIRLRRRWPALGAAWIVYVVTLLPVSGVFQNGPQVSADRYSYLPSLAWAVLAGAGALACRRAWDGRPRGRALASFMTGLAALVVAVLTILTWRQAGVWRDSERLWSHALAVAPSWMAHSHLGHLRRQQGRWAEANEHYRQASSMRPDAADLQVNWGNALVAAGELEEAIAHYREAVRIDPSAADAYNDWGKALARLGRREEAISKYRAALRIRTHSVPHYNWGNALFAAGELEEAIAHYREAVRIDPNAAEAHNNWGRALAQQGKWEEAISRYRDALRVRPDYPLASTNLDQALLRVGQAPAR